MALLDLPADIQRQVEAGQVPARTAYELSRLVDDNTRRELASQSVSGELTNMAAAQAVRQRQTRQPSKAQHVRQTFYDDNNCQVVITAPRESSYHEIEAALTQALEEVRHRIENGIRL